MRTAALACVLLLASLAYADPAITLPAEIHGKPGRAIFIEATTKGKTVKFFAFTRDADLFLVAPNKAVFVCPTPGNHTIIAWTCIEGEPTDAAVCTVIVNGPAPPPVPPPVPPIPPPPDPDAAFKAVLLTAWNMEADPGKESYRAKLAALYRAVGTGSKPASLTTNATLLKYMQDARKVLMPDAALLPLRQAIAHELDRTIGTSPAATIDWPVASTQFMRVARALEGLK